MLQELLAERYKIGIMSTSDTSDIARLFGSFSDGYGHCCPPVFDPYTLVALLGGIALATYFLRLVIVTQMFGGRSLSDRLFGNFQNCLIIKLCIT